jgi:hypothetical protein
VSASSSSSAATSETGTAPTTGAKSRASRREFVRRAVIALLLLWLLGLWIHQVVDRPGVPVDVGAIEAPRTLEQLGLPTAAERSGVVRGVVQTSNGESASDVLVTLIVDEELFWTHSDALGTFELRRLPRTGRATLAAVPMAAPGVDLIVELPLTDPLRVELPPRFAPTPTLPSIRRQVLEGRVTLTDDRDARGYELVLVPLEQTNAGVRQVPAPGLDGRVERRVEVDRDGRFRVDDLTLGSYQARVLPPWARGSNWPVLGTATITHDGRRGTALVEVRGGAIEGRVLDAAGAPIAGAVVLAASPSEPALMLPSLATDEEGRFVFEDVPEGSLRLRVRAGDRSSERTVRIGQLRREQVELRLLAPQD